MQFTSNTDGSITITWVLPTVVFSTLEDSVTFGTTLPKFMVVPTPTRSNGTLQTTNPGPGASFTSLGTGLGYYAAYAILHTQFGTNPNNTIKDFYQPAPITLSYENFNDPNDYLNAIVVSSLTMTTNISSTLLSDSRIDNGIYAIGYLGVLAVPGTNGQPASNFYVGQYDSGTNSSTNMPVPPSAPTGLQVSFNSAGQTVASWNNSIPGSAPIAGYVIRWSLNPGGPYLNSVNVPVGTGSNQTYTFPTAQFPNDGSTQNFVVQAYDNGTAPETGSLQLNPGVINYFPQAPAQ